MTSSPRVLLLAAGIAAVAAPLSAQTGFGVMGGVNFARFGGDDADAAGLDESRTAFLAGGFLIFNAGKHLVFRPELLYTQKGSKASSGSDEVVLRLDYLELPLLLQWTIPVTSPAVQPVVFAGPAGAIRVGCSVKVDIGGTTDSESCGNLGLDAVRNFDLALAFGAGAEVGNLGFGIRYGLGLVDLDEGGTSATNRVLSLFASYRFGLRR